MWTSDGPASALATNQCPVLSRPDFSLSPFLNTEDCPKEDGFDRLGKAKQWKVHGNIDTMILKVSLEAAAKQESSQDLFQS